MTTDYGDLSTTELTKMVNDEYGAIFENERSNLQKALAVGEKLKALRPRIAPQHGEWQAKLKVHCPKISYETATLYIRLFDNREELEKAAAAKSVKTTDLTIDEARKALAKPGKKGDGKGSSKPKSAAKAGVEPGNGTKSASLAPDQIVKDLEAGDLFDILKSVYTIDDLKELTKRLAGHLRMSLTPLTTRPTASPELRV